MANADRLEATPPKIGVSSLESWDQIEAALVAVPVGSDYLFSSLSLTIIPVSGHTMPG